MLVLRVGLKLRIALLLAAAGCQPAPEHGAGWHDVPVATVSPVAIDVDDAQWQLEVSSAVNDWNVALEASGCSRAFVIGEGGHEVRGWTAASWPYNTAWLGAEHEGDESIDVVANTPRVHTTTMHELGHAIGLVHITDRPSLMNPSGGEMNDEDIADACVVLSR